MILLTNGDSWTQGDYPSQDLNWEATKTLDWYDIVPNFGNKFSPTESKPPKGERNTLYKFYGSDVWPKVLGKKLGVETWNAGRLGDSNDRIFRTTIGSIEYLESLGKKDFFVVIGLTSMFRYETWNDTSITQNENKLKGKWIDARVLPHEYLDFAKESLVHRLCLNIINLQNFLKVRNIPYLIFNCFDDFDEEIREDSFFKYIDLDYIYNKDFKPHFRLGVETEFNTNWGNNDDYFRTNHPTDKSHIKWGEQLNKYIRSNYEFF